LDFDPFATHNFEVFYECNASSSAFSHPLPLLSLSHFLLLFPSSLVLDFPSLSFQTSSASCK
jgi:hypothetical protein